MKNRCSLLFGLGLVSVLTKWDLPAYAQQTEVPAVSIAVNKGEIGVQGIILSVNPKRGSLVLAVAAVYQSGGRKIVFTLPRSKTVFVNAKTAIQEPDTPGKAPALSNMIGLGAIVSGRDTGEGSTLSARQIVLWSSQTDAHVHTGDKDTGGTLPLYSVTEIGTLPGDIESEAEGINDKGEVVGQSIATYGEDGNGDAGHGFVWKAGQMYDLGVTQGYQSSMAFHINNAAQIVGSIDNFSTSSTRRPFSCGCWWQSGAIHILSPGLLSFGGLAFGINDQGVIVGTLRLPGARGREPTVSHAALWHNGRLTDLGTLPGFPNASAKAINIHGEIVCNADRFETVGDQVRFLSRAYLWRNGQKTDLGVLPRCNSSLINAINSAGEIIGQCSAETYRQPIVSQRAFIWQNHHMIELKGLEGSASSSPFGINDQGDIVGIGDLPTSGLRTEVQEVTDPPVLDFATTNPDTPKTTAVLWRAGQVYDLSRLIPNNSGWHLTSANAVNNRGQIVGQGLHDGKKRGYLLTPLL